MKLEPNYLGAPGAETCPQELVVTTWNVWFDKLHREERNRLLLDTLAPHRPHLMAFQEVTLPFVRALQATDWLQNDGYWLSAVDHQLLGAVIVSRLSVDDLRLHPLPGSMGRRLLVAQLTGGPTIATAHFESTASAGPVRAQQFEESFKILSGCRAAAIMGDFNSEVGDPEASSIPKGAVDAWTSLHPHDPGYSMDSALNGMLAKTARGEIKQRIDRVLCLGEIAAISIDRLGTKPTETGLFPSDHFGLITGLRHGR